MSNSSDAIENKFVQKDFMLVSLSTVPVDNDILMEQLHELCFFIMDGQILS